MHASYLSNNFFDISVEGKAAEMDDLFPDWDATDRVGVVVHEPYGGLGASLLMQSAMSQFYTSDTRRRGENPQYPPVFMFHVGGRYGDHSPMDIWPSRREVFVDNDPYEILGAIRDRAITRLAVPIGRDHGVDYAYAAPSGWTDLSSADELMKSCYLYSPDGHVEQPDIRVAANDSRVEGFINDVLDFEDSVEWYDNATEEDLQQLTLGPTVPSDSRGWLKIMKTRIDEVPAELRKRIHAERKAACPNDLPQQSYRRISIREAFGHLVLPEQ